jgi:Bacterial archaeo-eukaryotic release factor family 11
MESFPLLHIDLPARPEILQLAEERGGPCVSIYVSTTPLTEGAQIDRIELKNLLKEAVRQLEEADTPKRSVWPIEHAVEDVIADDDFWRVQARTLALFVTPDRIVAHRLPNRLESMVEVSDRFHIKPLLRAVTFPHAAYVLAIGMGAVRLIEVSADLPPHVVKVPGLPKDMADALGRRSHIERAIPGRSGENTSESAMMQRFSRVVDQALRPLLAGEDVPLIVAAAEPLASVYRAASSYPHTASQVIPGSADHTPDHVLAADARKVLDAVYAAELADLAGLFTTREAQGRATTDIAHAARAATFGAVDTLLVDMDEVVVGTVADDDGAVTFAETASAGNYGVVDEIASRALKSGARILAARRADIPGNGSLAAILRYAI